MSKSLWPDKNVRNKNYNQFEYFSVEEMSEFLGVIRSMVQYQEDMVQTDIYLASSLMNLLYIYYINCSVTDWSRQKILYIFIKYTQITFLHYNSVFENMQNNQGTFTDASQLTVEFQFSRTACYCSTSSLWIWPVITRYSMLWTIGCHIRITFASFLRELIFERAHFWNRAFPSQSTVTNPL